MGIDQMKTFFDTFDIFIEAEDAPEEITDAYFAEEMLKRTEENAEIFDRKQEERRIMNERHSGREAVEHPDGTIKAIPKWYLKYKDVENLQKN